MSTRSFSTLARPALLMTSLAVGVGLVSAADAAPDKIVKARIGPLPDLVIAVNAPATVNQLSPETITVRIDNVFQASPLPTLATTPAVGSPGVNGVSARVLVEGFAIVSATGDSGFSCVLGSGAAPMAAWCSGGSIAAGATATLTLKVKHTGSCVNYCGPNYVDAMVDNSGSVAERSEANNRDVGVTDTVGCIN
ncbi:MAG TPA: hypothetical protein VHM70_26090 [Polyangiaceae bacterium]|jgi:hypothetical protein|nr:hypothetical protein [Polyangiaceae bacterium]